MKKITYLLFFILSGCNFFEDLSEFFGPEFNEKVYVISSKNNKEPREQIKNQLKSLGIKYSEFITEIDTTQHQRIIQQNHKKFWQRIAYGEESRAIVLEDNVRLEKGFKKNLQRYIKDLPEDWDIAFLVIGRENNKYGWFISVGDIFRDIDEVKGHPYVAQIQKTNRVYGLYGYIINKKGAKKLLKLTEKPSDDISDIIFQKGGINTGHIKAYVSMFKLLEPQLTKTEIDEINNRSTDK